ncbi:hypothetical protein BASA81_014329 [Batrachochytrium salamandrivorans]|nr:hypothetical protein BASA81_014329 [Batrachochytrium salamandrivorans]
MDSKLAADLQIPLLELSTPITLRLADGDSSSSLTHRTVPLQLHIGKHVETATFYVTDLCHGFILGYSWLERHNPRINWVSRMVEFDSPYCLENCCDGSSRIQGLGKPPDISKTFELPLAPDTILIPVDLSPISCSLSDSISLESMQSDVYPFVEVSPVSDVSVPSDILSSFSSLFSEDQAETLPPHRDFDCAIDLKPGSEPFHGKIYQLTREEDKVMQEWIQGQSSKRIHSKQQFSTWRTMLLCKAERTNSDSVWTTEIFTTLDLRGAYNPSSHQGRRRVQDFFITKYGQFEFLVMPFGLANAPAQFQRMMNSLFRDVIGKHVLDLGCSELADTKESPGLASFVRIYKLLSCPIHDYSSMTANLTKLFKKDAPFVWGPEQEKSLQDLKTAFANSDFLTHPDDSRPFILETDASDYAISGVLSQYDDSNTLRPIAFYARQMN